MAFYIMGWHIDRSLSECVVKMPDKGIVRMTKPCAEG